MRTMWELFGLLAPLLATTACTSVLGVTDLPSTSCGGATGSNDCDDCQYIACCSELLACVDDSSCTNVNTCAEACDDQSGDAYTQCLDACAAEYPQGVDPYNAYLNCAEQQCASACASQ